MMERLGVQNEWRDKSKLAFAKLQQLLDPSFKFEFADPPTAGDRRARRAATSAPSRPAPARTPSGPGRGADQPGGDPHPRPDDRPARTTVQDPPPDPAKVEMRGSG